MRGKRAKLIRKEMGASHRIKQVSKNAVKLIWAWISKDKRSEYRRAKKDYMKK